MNLPMSWLNDYMDIDVTPKEYADRLTMTGSKVEGVENTGEEIQNVVAGKVLSCEPHPDSDHMSVCMVDIGEGEPVQIVCGAPNVKAGQTVPVAKHKSRLPGGVKITKGKLRGVMSNGMICSHEELGLTAQDLGYEPEYGILVLSDDIPAGKDIREVFGLNENVVEFEITSNRPDCFSIIGLARETAATLKKPFSVPEPKFSENSENISDTLSVEVLDKQKCLRYCAKMIKNVKIGPSPSWMVRRLHACGIRSINNIVDITNYVLLEYGQPMHAFDLRDLAGNKIIVRRADEGETIKTLDENDHTLTSDTLVISDAQKAVAIAGVMGGFNSEIKDDTTTVIFESATFDASSVRLTAQRAGLRTEASSRYEKGLDPNNTVPAVNRACELVEKLGCGEVVGGIIDICGDIKNPKELSFRPEKINAFLGTDISLSDMTEYLKALEFTVDTNKMTVTAPTFRPDIECEADVAEEIARFYGYDNIPSTLLSGEATVGGKTPEQTAKDRICELLTAQGLNETYTYTFTSLSIFDKLSIPADSLLRRTTKILNPLGEDTSVMRTTTIASMLEVLARNYNRKNENTKIFEIGKIYLPSGKAGELPDEQEIISMGMYGGNIDFYTIKGICEALADNLHVKNVTYEADSENPTFHPGRTAKILTCGKAIGIVGQIHPSVTERFGIDAPCYAAEINFTDLFENINSDIKYKQLPRFPAVTRDIAMLVDRKVPVAELETAMRGAAGKTLESITLFDVYEGEQIPEGKKSVAYAISFRAPDRSLTNEEVNGTFDKIVKALETKTGAQLR
jgi:phenylalanyl-tRNA synthetase beta chain